MYYINDREKVFRMEERFLCHYKERKKLYKTKESFMTIKYKFIAKSNNEEEIKALETLKENIEHKRKLSVERVKSTILPIRNVGEMSFFSIVVKCEGDFDCCGYKARMNNPERITNLLLRLSDKTGVNYDMFTPETMYSEMLRTECFTRNGISYEIHIKLERYINDGHSPSRKTRIMIRVNAYDVLTGSYAGNFPYVDFYNLENVPESYIRKTINEAIGRATDSMSKK